MQLIRLKDSVTQNMVLFLFYYLLFTCAIYFLIGISKYQSPPKSLSGLFSDGFSLCSFGTSYFVLSVYAVVL